MAEHEWMEGVVCFVDRAEIKSGMIAAVQAKWNAVRGTREFLTRRDIDPIEFQAWLPYLSLVEIHAGEAGAAPRIRYRLVGTEVARFASHDFSNTWLDETGWDPKIIAVNLALYRRVWETRQPVFGLSLVDWDKRQKYSFEWGLFPLSEDGHDINGCLSVDDFTGIAGRTHMLR
ncbi:PAS domain-containing protein [Dongia sp.]|uniref:PAS domain-containing protein n=1 Tax=Dongia sp. TaxID=1977262 RepID=UPI00375220C0